MPVEPATLGAFVVAGSVQSGLFFEPLSLVDRVDQLGVGVDNLPASDDELKAIGNC